MKQIIFLFFLAFSLSCSSVKKLHSQSNPLEGIWVPVRQEIHGKAIPELLYKNQQLIIKDSTYTMIAESIDRGTVKYKADKMDIFGKEGVNIGKHFKAIYKLENKQLTICYNLAGDSYPETFETKNKASYFLAVFVKN